MLLPLFVEELVVESDPEEGCRDGWRDGDVIDLGEFQGGGGGLADGGIGEVGWEIGVGGSEGGGEA